MEGQGKWRNIPVNLKGRCFLCLNQLTRLENKGGRTPPPASYSLRYLFLYLKLDLRKLVIETEKNSSDSSTPSLTNGDSCRMEVGLCEDCLSIHEEFLDMFQRLHQIELEMTNSLQRIQGKLTNGLCCPGEFNGKEESKIVMAIREEVIQKCSMKVIEALSNAQDIIAEAMNAEKRELKSSSQITIYRNNMEVRKSNSDDNRTSASFKDVIKTEPHSDQDDDDIERNYGGGDDSDYNDDGQEMQESDADAEEETENANANFGESNSSGGQSSLLNPYQELDDTEEVNEQGRNSTPESSLNPKTGKHKCSRCSKEFATKSQATVHFNGVHRNMKYNCTECPMQFLIKHSLKRHQMVVHMGLKFSCYSCKEVFTQIGSLRRHQRKKGCDPGPKPNKKEGRRPICQVCGKSSQDSHALNLHLRTVHAQEREHVCDICGKKFGTNSVLYRHRRNIHSQQGERTKPASGSPV